MARSQRDSEAKHWMTAMPTRDGMPALVNPTPPDDRHPVPTGLGALASEVEGRAVKLLLALHELTGAGHTAKEEPAATSPNRLQAVSDRLTRASAMLTEALSFVEREIAAKL